MTPSKLFNSIAAGISYLPTGLMMPVMGAASYVAASQVIAAVPTTGSAALCAAAVATCATFMKSAQIKQSRSNSPR